MHIYKDKDGRIVIDLEGDLVVSANGPVRISNFGETPLTLTGGVFCLKQENDGIKDKIKKSWFSFIGSNTRIFSKGGRKFFCLGNKIDDYKRNEDKTL